MPSSATAGMQGQFKIGAVAMVQVSSVEINVGQETYDITVMAGTTAATWKQFLAGLLSYDLKVMGFYDIVNDAVQATIWSNMVAATSVAWSFSPNAGGHTYSGTAIIKSIPMKFPANNAETIEFDFQGSGSISYS